MFDLKSMIVKTIEDKVLNLSDYIFLPERIDLTIDNGQLTCLLNTNGKVDIIYSKGGVTEVQSALRKNPYTSFKDELAYGVYDSLVDNAVKTVNDIIAGRSKYFTF